MRFLLKLLPTLLIILLFGVIYLGVKKTINFYNNNADAYYSSLVTENSENDVADETFNENTHLNDVKKSGAIEGSESSNKALKGEKRQQITNESPGTLKKRVKSKGEASLDEELEGKSSSQFLAAADKAEKKENIKKEASKKRKPKVSASKSKIAATLRAKGAAPVSYEVGSENVEFLVIAGAFQSMNNANNFVDDLEGVGIRNAEILQFNNKKFNSVCVSRHTNYNAAKAAIKALKKSQNIDAYVHRLPLK